MDSYLNCLPFYIVFYQYHKWGGWLEVATEWQVKQCITYLHFPQASTKPHCCSKCHRKQLNHCTIQLASCVAIYSYVQLHQWSGEPITDNWGTHGHLTQLANQPQQKQTEQPLALIHTWIFSGLMWLLNGDKRWALKWCVYKTLLANLVKYVAIY